MKFFLDGYELAPLVLAFILGPQMEQAFRQSLIMSDGSFLVFFTRPISAGAMGLAAFLLISAFIPAWKNRRKRIEGGIPSGHSPPLCSASMGADGKSTEITHSIGRRPLSLK